MALALEIFHTLPPTWLDTMPSLQYGSLTVRLNTLDFTLFNPADAADLVPGQEVRITALGWSGRIASVETRWSHLRSNDVYYVVTATNSSSPLTAAGGASMTLSDQPTAVLDDYLLEDGSGRYALESGSLTEPGALQMQGDLLGYQQLSIRTQANGVPTGFSLYPPTSTLGTLTTFQGGLWPGIQFTLYSLNQGISGVLYTVTETRIMWPRLDYPFFEVTFGLPPSVTANDPPWTLSAWTKALIHG